MSTFTIAVCFFVLALAAQDAHGLPLFGGGRGPRGGGHGHHGRPRGPPVCLVKNGTQVLCDKSDKCADFSSTCSEFNSNHSPSRGGLTIKFCIPNTCVDNSTCAQGTSCRESRMLKGLRCLPNHHDHDQRESSEEDEENDSRPEMCGKTLHDIFGGRGHHHGPPRPRVCLVSNGTQELCNKASLCPNFTTCSAPPVNFPLKPKDLTIKLCIPVTCVTNSTCPQGSSCRKTWKLEGLRCLPNHHEHDHDESSEEDEEKDSRSEMCGKTVHDIFDRPGHHHGRGHRGPLVCLIKNGTAVLCNKACPSFAPTCSAPEVPRRRQNGDLTIHFCVPKTCVDNSTCPEGSSCRQGRRAGELRCLPNSREDWMKQTRPEMCEKTIQDIFQGDEEDESHEDDSDEEEEEDRRRPGRGGNRRPGQYVRRRPTGGRQRYVRRG